MSKLNKGVGKMKQNLVDVRRKAREAADNLNLNLGEMQLGYVFKCDAFSVMYYSATGAIVVRKKGVKVRKVGCVGIHKLEEFLRNEINGSNSHLILDPIDAVGRIMGGENLFFIEKSMAQCAFELWEDCETMTISDASSGKFVFRLKPISVNINGTEYIDMEKAKEVFMAIYNGSKK